MKNRRHRIDEASFRARLPGSDKPVVASSGVSARIWRRPGLPGRAAALTASAWLENFCRGSWTDHREFLLSGDGCSSSENFCRVATIASSSSQRLRLSIQGAKDVKNLLDISRLQPLMGRSGMSPMSVHRAAGRPTHSHLREDEGCARPPVASTGIRCVTYTSTNWTDDRGSGMGSSLSRSISRWYVTASRIRSSVSDKVSPAATQPGRSGRYAE